jgi:hypothetical protein
MEFRSAAQPAPACLLCARAAGTGGPVCAGCQRAYGPRVALLLARAERDADFAAACLANLPPPLRQRFAALLGQRCLMPGADTRTGPGLRRARPRASAAWLARAN